MNGPTVFQAPVVEEAAPRAGCFTHVAFVVATLWLAGIIGVGQLAIWFADQIATYENTPVPSALWPPAAWAVVVLAALPIALLAALTRVPRFRIVYRAWLAALCYAFWLGLARIFPTTATQPAALAQIGLTLLAVVLLLALARRRGSPVALSVRAGALLFALALAPLIGLPFLAWGALGSRLDTVLALVAALSFGLLAGLLLDLWLLRPLAELRTSSGRELAGHGFAAGIALLILGSGFGVGGGQLLLLVVVPPLGFVAAALRRMASPELSAASLSTAASPSDGRAHRSGWWGGGWLPIAALVGLAAAAPLALVDASELSILLGNDEILQWAAKAASVSLIIGFALAAFLWLLRSQLLTAPRVAVSAPALIAFWGIALAVYFFVGKPGYYGEQFFVILREQADLRAAYNISDRTERAKFVYTTLTQHANRTQAGMRDILNRARTGYRPYYLLNAIEVNAGPLTRAQLAALPEVDRILDSPHLRPLPAQPPVSTGDQPKPTGPQWDLTQIGADRVWTELGVTGQGIVVGQSDSGVQGDHPVLRDGYRGRGGSNDYNWLDPWNGSRSPTDIGGHGTHTLGSIVGRDNIGVAPGAEWFGCVNLARNLGNPAVYLDCMQFMLAPYPQGAEPFTAGDPARGAHVINDSWGCPPVEGCDANVLAPAAAALRAAGVFVVVSAGNEGPRCGSVDSPLALYGEVFSVGAIDRFGELATFSSRGPVMVDGSNRVKPDIVAPGVDVLSSFPGNTYAIESGTSMAGPHVAGVVALMWSAQPKLIGDIDRTTLILRQTAKPYTGKQPECSDGSLPNNATGYGIVDAYAAVKAAMELK
jgi:hypothetical protein